MNKVYGFLFTVLVMGLGFCAGVLTYLTYYNDFFIVGTFILAALFIGAVLAFTTWLSALFALVFFGILLLTGMILFPLLFVEDSLLLALLLVVGSVGFVSVLLMQTEYSRRRKQRRVKVQPVVVTNMPPTPLPSERAKATTVTTYEVEKPTLQDLDLFATMKREEDKDFIELNEIERLMKEEQKQTKVVRKKRRK